MDKNWEHSGRQLVHRILLRNRFSCVNVLSVALECIKAGMLKQHLFFLILLFCEQCTLSIFFLYQIGKFNWFTGNFLIEHYFYTQCSQPTACQVSGENHWSNQVQMCFPPRRNPCYELHDLIVQQSFFQILLRSWHFCSEKCRIL